MSSEQPGSRIEERRKKRRFALRQTVVLKLHKDDQWIECRGITENVSEIGTLIILRSFDCPVIGCEVAVQIIDSAYPVRLSCRGKVTRVERRFGGETVAIAIRCDGFRIFKAVTAT